MKGDLGTIHIELGPDWTPEQAEELSDRIANMIYGKRRYRKKDALIHAHYDGPCETSPHCFPAFIREGLGEKCQKTET